MAQLPPKIPTMTQNWPSFAHQTMPTMANYIAPIPPTLMNANHGDNANYGNGGNGSAAAASNHHPSWVDEFLDFSSVRRGAHRRSMSDSIAFLDPPQLMMEECSRINIINGDDSSTAAATAAMVPETNNGFDRLDDEKLMSMFSDDISISAVPGTVSSSNPSTPSDQNSNNDEKTTATPMDHQSTSSQLPKGEPGEVESSCKAEPQPSHQPPASSNGDSIVDPKRVKRILANRQSAQRSRVRKLQYISELERSVSSLQSEVSALSPRVAFLDHQRLILNVDNSALKQRIAALAQDKIFKDAHQEALKKEIERLRQLYHQQSLKKMGGGVAGNNHAPPPNQPQQQLNTEAMVVCTEKESNF